MKKMKKSITGALLVVFLLVQIVAITACSTYQAFDYKDQREEMPGPGLFTGEQGEYTLFRISKTTNNTGGEENAPELQE